MVTEAPYTGTERYKAPELFILSDNPRPKPTTEGDIYALGCLLMEVRTGENYSHVSNLVLADH
jgi:serine/threonine protein kinase